MSRWIWRFEHGGSASEQITAIRHCCTGKRCCVLVVVWCSRCQEWREDGKAENNLFLTNEEVDSFLNVFLKTLSHSFLYSGFIRKNCQLTKIFRAESALHSVFLIANLVFSPFEILNPSSCWTLFFLTFFSYQLFKTYVAYFQQSSRSVVEASWIKNTCCPCRRPLLQPNSFLHTEYSIIRRIRESLNLNQ